MAGAATFNAATGNTADIQSAINLTANGDIVLVPNSNVGWSTNLVVNTNIKIIGTGIGSCIVTDNIPRLFNSTEKAILWTANTSQNECMLSGFEFRGGAAGNPGTGFIWVQGTGFMMRICSNYWNNVDNRSIQWHGWVNGVVDHNIHMAACRQFIEIWHDGYGGGSFGDKSWADVDTMGTTNGVVLEDNILLETFPCSSGGEDMMGGARVTSRFQTFSNCVDATHGTESTGRQRSVRTFESYNNHYQQVGGFLSSAGQIRGGTSVVCSNTYVGPDYAFGRGLSCYREIYAFTHWGAANGTNGYDTNSLTVFDTGTHTGANAATVLSDNTKTWNVNGWVGTNIVWNVTKNMASVVTANTANTVTYDLSGSSVTGGPNMTFDIGDTYRIMAVLHALDQPGVGQQMTPFTGGSDPAVPAVYSEVSDPIYSWSNTVNGVLGMNVGSGYPSVLLNRDYFINTIKPGWIPLVYPHPLVSGGPVPPPPATSIARVTTLRAGKTVVGP